MTTLLFSDKPSYVLAGCFLPSIHVLALVLSGDSGLTLAGAEDNQEHVSTTTTCAVRAKSVTIDYKPTRFVGPAKYAAH